MLLDFTQAYLAPRSRSAFWSMVRQECRCRIIKAPLPCCNSTGREMSSLRSVQHTHTPYSPKCPLKQSVAIRRRDRRCDTSLVRPHLVWTIERRDEITCMPGREGEARAVSVSVSSALQVVTSAPTTSGQVPPYACCRSLQTTLNPEPQHEIAHSQYYISPSGRKTPWHAPALCHFARIFGDFQDLVLQAKLGHLCCGSDVTSY